MSSEVPQITTSIRRRLADLQTYQLPRLRECKGPIDLQRELSAELKEDIRRIKRSLDELDALAYEQPTEKERTELMNVCKELESDLDQVHHGYREALLESTRKMKAATAASYELLPETTPADSVPISKASSTSHVHGQDDALQTKTNEVTDALRRTAATMRAELDRSVLATQLLDESSQTLRSTSGLYDTYSNLLTTSTRLVKQLEKADWYDKLIIFCALGFFFLVVAFIIKRRVLDRAVNGVGWWVGGSYRLMTGQWKGKAARAAAKKGKDVVHSVSAASSVVSAVGGRVSEGASQAFSTQVEEALVTGIPEAAQGRIRNEL